MSGLGCRALSRVWHYRRGESIHCEGHQLMTSRDVRLCADVCEGDTVMSEPRRTYSMYTIDVYSTQFALSYLSISHPSTLVPAKTPFLFSTNYKLFCGLCAALMSEVSVNFCCVVLIELRSQRQRAAPLGRSRLSILDSAL